MVALNCIGIDVSKDKLDTNLLRPNGKQKEKSFDNTASGHGKLLVWAQTLTGEESRHFAMEATGSYSNALSSFLAEQRETVSVINPARVKYYGIVQGVLNKTDRADARLIAQFCQVVKPEPWRQSSPAVALLSALTHRRQQLVEQRVAETNRLAQPGLPKVVRQSIEKTIGYLKEEIAEIDKAISEHIEHDPHLKADHKLLTSIPGIGDILSSVMLAELPTLSECTDSSAIGSYAGLSPREHRSGTSVHHTTRISKSGNATLRSALYLPAMSAMRYNPLVKEFYDRLVGRGGITNILI